MRARRRIELPEIGDARTRASTVIDRDWLKSNVSDLSIAEVEELVRRLQADVHQLLTYLVKWRTLLDVEKHTSNARAVRSGSN